jgi:hypothetical protein
VAAAPKLSLTESAGKLLNYMAASLPTVAFDTPVAREYLGAHGVLCRTGQCRQPGRQTYVRCSATREGQQIGRTCASGRIEQFEWNNAARVIEDRRHVHKLTCSRVRWRRHRPQVHLRRIAVLRQAKAMSSAIRSITQAAAIGLRRAGRTSATALVTLYHRYRELVYNLVQRELKARYQATACWGSSGACSTRWG